MVEYIAELKLFNCVFDMEDDQDDEDEEANNSSVIIEKLFKATIESASNAHSNTQEKHLMNIIGKITNYHAHSK